MKQNKGFTLIEMLVVIGIIGILAAVVLTALGPSRNKAKDTRILSAVNQVRSLAEVNFNPSANVYADISGNATFTQLSTDVTANSSALVYNIDASGQSYTAFASLASDTTQGYCVDSTGFGGVITGTGAVAVGISCQ